MTRRLPIKPLRHHVRLKSTKRGLELQVEQFYWRDAYTPRSHWLPIRQAPPGTSYRELRDAVDQVLRRSEHFRRCRTCGFVGAAGYFGSDQCHGCMESAGTVF